MRENSDTTRNVLVFFLVVAALAVYGLVTMQWLMAVLLIALVGAVVIFYGSFRDHSSDNRNMKFRSDFSAALFIAVLVAFFGMAVAQWLVWAVALTALLLILQILSRIERRLDERETGGLGPGPEKGENGNLEAENILLTRE